MNKGGDNMDFEKIREDREMDRIDEEVKLGEIIEYLNYCGPVFIRY